MKNDILVTKPFLPDREVFKRYIDEIWDNQWLTNQGPLHEQFRNELKNYLKVPFVTPTVNGHLGLEIAIKGLDLKGEVITTPFTFASTIHALTLNNIKPVFCDIKESDFTLDADLIEGLITEKTTAIMPVHVYGHVCDTEKIDAIAHKHGLKVIYDAAHAFGVKKNGISVGLYGDVAMFSFHATKLFNTIEGGALVYRSPEYEYLFNAYKNFGIESEEMVSYVGGNAKMNEFQAAMGLANLPYMDIIIKKRKQLTLKYRELLGKLPGIYYYVPENQNGIETNYAYFAIRVDETKAGITRDELYMQLKQSHIFTRKYFYPIATQYGCYQDIAKDAKVPVAEKVGDSILTLPLYFDMELETVEFVCEKISDAISG